MDRLDRLILDDIQKCFPICHQPYERIAQDHEITEEEAWRRILNLKNTGIIRRIGGIFDSRSLGYVSTLCAASVPEVKIEEVALFMKGITEITHSYVRNHPKYNLWFTIIAASPQHMNEIIDAVKGVLGSQEVYSMPALHLFKIGVQFNLSQEHMSNLSVSKDNLSKQSSINKIHNGLALAKNDNENGNGNGKNNRIPLLTEEDKDLIRLLQGDLPSSLQPFHELASRLNIDVKMLLEKTAYFLNAGIMRRLGAILIHHQAGYTSNGMGVWVVPEVKIKEVGHKMAAFKEVSHCYHRPTLPDWPYNLFTMVHGHSDEECHEIMTRISQATGMSEYSLLFSRIELKKSSMRYFA